MLPFLPKCFTECGKVTNNFRSVFRTRVPLMSATAFFGNPYSSSTLSSVNNLRMSYKHPQDILRTS